MSDDYPPWIRTKRARANHALAMENAAQVDALGLVACLGEMPVALQGRWWRAVLREDPCTYCGTRPSETADHVVPRSQGGEDDDRNLVSACGTCNRSKGSAPLLRWLHRRALAERQGRLL